MFLPHMNDSQRAQFIRRICFELGREYDTTLAVDFWAEFMNMKEKAERYDDLCR